MKPIAPVIAVAAFALSAFSAAFAQDTPPPSEQATATAQAGEQTAPATEQAAATQEAAAPADPAAPGLISSPPDGKGQIVFFRPNRLVGMALSFTVRENDAGLGRLPNGRYFVHVAEPGIHEYEVGRNDTLRIEIEPGETYYVQQNIAMGIIGGRAVLAPTDQVAFEAAAGRMRPSDPITE